MAQAKQYFNVTLPMGRIVGGSLYDPRTTDAENRPLVYKTGAQAGQPRVDFYVAIAIPKTPGCQHWAHERSTNPRVADWGNQIYQAAAALWGNTIQQAGFAFKIDDGDSAVPNTKGVPPNSRVGYPGHWVLHLGRSSTPNIVNSDGSARILEPNAVKPGYFVQAGISINSNNSSNNPGIFLNHDAISLQFVGEEINFGPNVSQMGFGGNTMPAGAQQLPAGALPGVAIGGQPQMGLPPIQQQIQQPVINTPQPQVMQQPVIGQPQMGLPPIQQQVAAPNHQFVQNAGLPQVGVAGAPVMNLPPMQIQQPVVQAVQMGSNAQGYTIEQWRAQGYDDATLRTNGVII